jgi:hypothetical protein
MPAFAKYSSVVLTRDITEDGLTFPKGTQGVIVECDDDGISYLIEISDPMFAVVSVMSVISVTEGDVALVKS